MFRSNTLRVVGAVVLLSLSGGCAYFQQQSQGDNQRVTKRDKTKKGAAIGAGVGAVLGAVIGEGEADEILASAAIGAGIGAGVGAYMDRQEERLAQIPGTTLERVDKDMILMHFNADLLFDVDSAMLGSDALYSLNEAARVFLENPKTAVVCQGHTDSTGTESHNQTLSERRARSVMNHLIGQGVDPDRMIELGHGESHPVASNDSADGRRRNRRVDLLIKAKAR